MTAARSTSQALPIFGHIGQLDHWVRGHSLTEGPQSLAARMLDRSQAWGGGWGTHVPLLAAVVASARPGAVIELGGGHYSTALLAEMCRAMGREFYSVDHDAKWASANADLCEVQLVPSWGEFRALEWTVGAVIFIDNEPGPDRCPNLKWARAQKPQFIVCHDTLHPQKEDREWYSGMDAELSTFKYRYDYVSMASATSVVSDFKRYAGAR
jgi:hypothetical protein